MSSYALNNVTSLSFAICYINQVSAPFIFRKSLKDMLSIAVSIDYKLIGNEKRKLMKKTDDSNGDDDYD